MKLNSRIIAGAAIGCVHLMVVSSATVTLTAAPLLPGQAEMVLSLAPGNSPEGITVEADGTIYFSNRRPTNQGLLSEIIRIGTDGKRSTLALFEATDDPDANGILGLAVEDGDVYAALDTRQDTTHGVWKVAANGKKLSRLLGTEGILLPNALTFDHAGNLFVSDSVGAIWRCRPEQANEPATVWASHELLAPFFDFDPIGLPDEHGEILGVPLPGANGVAYVAPNHLYVANTERGLILHISINPDGSADVPEVVAGDPFNPYTPLLTVDGIAADSSGDIHAVVPGFIVLLLFGIPASPLVEMDAGTGAIDFTVTDPAVAFGFFDTPLSLAFGRLPGDETSVYVANGALFPDLLPGSGPGIVRAGVNP